MTRSASEELIIYADGGISPKAAGVGIVASNGNGRIVSLANRTLPQMTNNEAEYAALVMALELAAQLRSQSVEIRLDSEVVVYQMIGRFAVNSAKLKPWHRKACALARAVPSLSFTHIRREENLLADALAAEAIAGRRWRMRQS
jgi:ribonuclease HI